VSGKQGMRVLHVYRTYFPETQGGLEEAIRQICLATQPLGVENTVFTLSTRPGAEMYLERPEARVVRRRSWAAPASCDLGGIGALREFRRLAREADVVHYLFPWPFADLLHLLAPAGKPSVLTYVSDIVRQRWLGRLYRPLMWRTLRQMDAIVANSPAYARTSPVLSDPAVRDRVRVIPLGIDESSVSQVPDPGVLDRLGIEGGEPFMLFVGVLRYYKGLHVLLQAAKSVKGRIVIAGEGPEGDALRGQARALGLENVLFAGRVSDGEKSALLAQCCALVLPSHLRSEAYGMVLVEAAMAGKPMVTCEIGTGTSYINANGETGVVVAPENSTALAAAMQRLLDDEALALRYGQAARRRYECLFSGPAMGEGYMKMYADVLAKYR